MAVGLYSVSTAACTVVHADDSRRSRHPITEGTTSTSNDHRQVFWLTDHPTNHAFSTVRYVVRHDSKPNGPRA